MSLFPLFKKPKTERADSELTRLLTEPLSEFFYSGFQLFTERRGKSLELHGGRTSHWPDAVSVESSTLFDIASVTKVLATTSCLARAIDRHELKLDEDLATLLPKFQGTGYAKIQIADLLSHSSGAIGWYPFFQEAVRADGLQDWFVAHEKKVLVDKKGARAIYSDFGFLLLGLIVQNHWGSLASAFESEVLGPLQMENVSYGPMAKAENVVATEYSYTRNKLLQGEVFDENAHALGGSAAHAGLFASAISLAPFCREWLLARNGQSSWLTKETAVRFTTPSKKAPGSTWALGWDTKSSTGSTAGEKFGSHSFGGLGYTGCLMWIDPDAEGFGILLTNRVHPSRYDERFRKIRPKIFDAIFDLWEEWG